MTTNARPRDKTEFLAGLTGRQSVFGTVGHDIHHIRRSALDAFSSKKSIAAFEPSVREKVAELCDAMKRQADNDNVLNLNTAFTALALDVISLYGFGKSYGLLQKPEFAPNWRQMLHNTLESFPLMRHVPWLPAMLKKLPHSIRNLVSKDLALCLELEEVCIDDSLFLAHSSKASSLIPCFCVYSKPVETPSELLRTRSRFFSQKKKHYRTRGPSLKNW